jgi:hypothetical protein
MFEGICNQPYSVGRGDDTPLFGGQWSFASALFHNSFCPLDYFTQALHLGPGDCHFVPPHVSKLSATRETKIENAAFFIVHNLTPFSARDKACDREARALPSPAELKN